MKTHFDKTLLDNSAENRTWIMGLTFASIIVVLGIFILPFLDEMVGDGKKEQEANANLPLQLQTPSNQGAPQPNMAPRNTPNLDPSPDNFMIPAASGRSEDEELLNLPLADLENLPLTAEAKDDLPLTANKSPLNFVAPPEGTPDDKSIIPLIPSSEFEDTEVPAPPETTADPDADLFAALESIPSSISGNKTAYPSPATDPSPSPIFKVVSDEELQELEDAVSEYRPPLENTPDPVSNLTKEIRTPKEKTQDELYNNSLIQKYRKKSPEDPASNKELTEAMGDYYKQEGTFLQYEEKFPDWAAQYNEIKKTSTGPVLFRP